MKILMLVNWKIEYCEEKPVDKQPPDYCVKGEPYWFYRHFEENPEVDVVDISSFKWLENFEKHKLRFYVWQTLKVITKLRKYDLIVSHGMQSGVVLCLWRRIFKTKAKHVVFDIGSFNSASESGLALKLMQFASKSLDGVIYHTSSQINYYKKFFPWVVDKAQFIHFGVDFDYFGNKTKSTDENDTQYIICVGKNRSDWNTAIEAYNMLHTSVKLRFIGAEEEKISDCTGIEQLPYMPINDLIAQIEGAVLCLLPLEYVKYSFGQMRFLQQQALGKCVVASRIPSLVDYAVDGETAVFYEPQDAKDCAGKMKMLLDNSELREKIGWNAKQETFKRFNEKAMAKNIEEAYITFLGRNKS